MTLGAPSELERFLSRVTITTTCWIWEGGLNRKGYGEFSLEGFRVGKAMAHRYLYELAHGKIEDGMVIDHLCKNTRCVRPSHLEVVSIAENNRRRGPYKHTCVNGHSLLDEQNVRRKPNGVRLGCRECHRLQSKAERDRRKERKVASGSKQ